MGRVLLQMSIWLIGAVQYCLGPLIRWLSPPAQIYDSPLDKLTFDDDCMMTHKPSQSDEQLCWPPKSEDDLDD